MLVLFVVGVITHIFPQRSGVKVLVKRGCSAEIRGTLCCCRVLAGLSCSYGESHDLVYGCGARDNRDGRFGRASIGSTISAANAAAAVPATGVALSADPPGEAYQMGTV